MAQSASTGGALKQYIESLGLALAVFRDRAPQTQKLPYCTTIEQIALVFDVLEDGGDPAALAGAPSGSTQTARETAQVDLWQQWKDPGSEDLTESYTLALNLVRALHGAKLTQSPQRAYKVLVRNSIRLLEEDANLVHHAITLEIRRAV